MFFLFDNKGGMRGWRNVWNNVCEKVNISHCDPVRSEIAYFFVVYIC